MKTAVQLKTAEELEAAADVAQIETKPKQKRSATMTDTEINLPDLSDDRLWRSEDVARYLSMSRSWVYQRSAAGELPHLNIGGALRFDPQEIKAWALGARPPVKVVPIGGQGRG